MNSRLQKHLVAAAAVTAGIASAAQAAVVFQSVNINIPDNIDGVYLNVVTLAQGTTSGVAGWDINPYSASTGSFNLWGPSANTWFSVGSNYNLAAGTLIGGDISLFSRPGGGTNVGTQMNLNSNQNLLGFRFVNEANANQVHFGWIRVEFGATAGSRTITEIGYESVAGQSIAAGVPAPGAIALMGVAGLVGRRRRR
ncbi:MAG: hypothetical protein U0625_08575 [Phycisphaerales bacterium]